MFRGLSFGCTFTTQCQEMIKTDKLWWEKAIKNGIFAALFVTLLVYVIRTNDARETRYIEMIDTLHNTVDEKLVELKGMHTGAKS